VKINMYNDRRPKFSPVREGEEIDVKIEAVGEKGDGIAKKNGFVLFIPGVNEGDEVRIRITRVLKKVGFAEKIGAAQGPIESSQPRRQEAAVVPPPVITSHEDSEDFGEEADIVEESDDTEDLEDFDETDDIKESDDTKDLEDSDETDDSDEEEKQ
jgi:predicted RNA-binding protein with TRAM domain